MYIFKMFIVIIYHQGEVKLLISSSIKTITGFLHHSSKTKVLNGEIT